MCWPGSILRPLCRITSVWSREKIELQIEGLTSPSRTTHGVRTSNEKKAEMILGGSFSSGRKVCCISGRGWKEASSGWTGAGCDGGT